MTSIIMIGTTSLLPSDVCMTIKINKNFIHITSMYMYSVRSMINCAFNLVLSFQENSDNSLSDKGMGRQE